MADIENEPVDSDTSISGPDDTDTTEPVVRVCNVYRIDFDDGTTKAYVAKDDIAAIYLAGHDKPGVARLQISCVRKGVTVGEEGQ